MSANHSFRPNAEQRLLKSSTRTLLGMIGDRVAPVACRIKSSSQLAAYGNPNTDSFAPVDVIAALENVAGEPLITETLAGLAGCNLVRRIESSPTVADWHSALAEAVKETDDVIQRVLRALPNGVSAAEIRAGEIRREIAEAQQRLAHLDALCARALETEQ